MQFRCSFIIEFIKYNHVLKTPLRRCKNVLRRGYNARKTLLRRSKTRLDASKTLLRRSDMSWCFKTRLDEFKAIYGDLKTMFDVLFLTV